MHKDFFWLYIRLWVIRRTYKTNLCVCFAYNRRKLEDAYDSFCISARQQRSNKMSNQALYINFGSLGFRLGLKDLVDKSPSQIELWRPTM